MPTYDAPPLPVGTYAVVFVSRRATAANETDADDYAAAAERMLALAAEQPGYLGVDTAPGITVSYWESLDAIAAWREQADHAVAQTRGRAAWYAAYALHICRVEESRVWRS